MGHMGVNDNESTLLPHDAKKEKKDLEQDLKCT